MVGKSTWGPPLWRFIHSFALHKSKAETRRMLYGVIQLLPCDECRRHYIKYITEFPPSGDLFEWTVRLHNSVNRRLGKHVMTLTDAKYLYQNTRP